MVKRVLVAYSSRTGMTEKMAHHIAEGVRFSGKEAELKKISEIRSENFKSFLFLAQKGGLEGKVGGAFGSSTHSGEAPRLIFDTMEYVFKMTMTSLGPFCLREKEVGPDEGMRNCQTYGRNLGQELGS